MKNKTLKRTLITLTLAFLPVLNGQMPSPTPVPDTVAAENAAEEETDPGIQPLNDYERGEKVKE